jgi:hypothetical protein
VSNAGFLLIAVAGSVALSLLVWAFNRKPKTFMSSIDDFSREMKALGHDAEDQHGGRRRRGTGHPPGRRSSRPTAIDPGLTHPPTPPTRRGPANGLPGPGGAADPEEHRP